MKKTKSAADASAMIKSVLIALGFSLLVIVALCALAAACVHSEKLPEHAMRYCAWAICTLSAAAGCLTAQTLAGRARLPVSLVCAALLLAVMAAVRAVLGDGEEAAWYGALIVCLTAVGSALAKAGRRNRRR